VCKTASVTTLCTIKTNYNLKFDELEDFTTENEDLVKKLRYEIEMIPSGAFNEFNVLYEGYKLGTQNARTVLSGI
jgi:hypothetical protein